MGAKIYVYDEPVDEGVLRRVVEHLKKARERERNRLEDRLLLGLDGSPDVWNPSREVEGEGDETT